jgi:hypothetical protein
MSWVRRRRRLPDSSAGTPAGVPWLISAARMDRFDWRFASAAGLR